MSKYPSLLTAICLILFLNLRVFAQAPGYMGKRLSISYGMHLNPAFSKSTVNGGVLNTKHEVNFGFCTSERFQVCLSAEFYRTIYNNALAIYTIGASPTGFYNINGGNYSILFKKFRKVYVAPWGAYFMYGPQVNIYKTEYNNYMNYTIRANNHDTLISDFGPKIQNYFKADFIFGWGKTRVIKDKIIIDWGLTFRMRSFLSAMGSSLSSFFSYDASDYIKRTAAMRTNRLNAWDAYVRLGYLF